MLQPFYHRHTVKTDHDNYDLAHGPSWARVGPRPGADNPRDTAPSGPRYTLSRKQTINNLITATTRMQGLGVERANDCYNPSNDPAVTELIRRLLTPGLHMCGRQVVR
jgi:hypothetical protein